MAAVKCAAPWAASKRTLLSGDLEHFTDMMDALVERAEPWTAKQSLSSILGYLSSEVKEAEEELRRLEASAGATARLSSELGDVLACTLLALAVAHRDFAVRPDLVARGAQEKFRRRAGYFFEGDGGVQTFEDATAWWQQAKQREAAASTVEPATAERSCAAETALEAAAALASSARAEPSHRVDASAESAKATCEAPSSGSAAPSRGTELAMNSPARSPAAPLPESEALGSCGGSTPARRGFESGKDSDLLLQSDFVTQVVSAT